MTDDHPATATAFAIADRVRRGEWSPVDVIEALLDRIDRLEPQLNAFVALDRDGAMGQARRLQERIARGEGDGSLLGVPVTIKDFQDVAGLPTRRGSTLTESSPAAADAPLVERLRRQGAIVVGKTTCPEMGWTAISRSPLTGYTHNPWRHGLTAGGSSSGAAALAGAGCGPLHLGTDGAGSIRVPAHFCGVVGFKPTYGRVPYAPVPNNGYLSHAGPITRTVEDAALMYSVMAGPHPADHTTLPEAVPAGSEPGGLTGLRIAYSPDLGHARVDPEVAAIVRAGVDSMAAAGAEIEEVTPPWGDHAVELERDLWGFAYGGYAPADETTAAAMDPGLVACSREYAHMSAAQALDAQRRRIAYAAEVNLWFEDVDLLVTPSACVAAFDVDRLRPQHWPAHDWDWLAWAEFSYPFNLSHGPAISVPCGLTSDGLPVGLQFGAGRLADARVLRAAAAFLELRPFRTTPAE